MATRTKRKAPARRRRATGYTVGPRRIRRRKMNGIPTIAGRRRTTRRIGAKPDVAGTLVTALQLVGGGLLAGGAMNLLARPKEDGTPMVPNHYVRAAIVGGVGIVAAITVPVIRPAALGMITVAGVGAGQAAMAEMGMQGPRRSLPPAVQDRITQALRAAQLNGYRYGDDASETLAGARPTTLQTGAVIAGFDTDPMFS